jgi:hypothetical protein
MLGGEAWEYRLEPLRRDRSLGGGTRQRAATDAQVALAIYDSYYDIV